MVLFDLFSIWFLASGVNARSGIFSRGWSSDYNGVHVNFRGFFNDEARENFVCLFMNIGAFLWGMVF